MDWITLESQEGMIQMLSGHSFDHAFVKELHCISPSYLSGSGVAAAEAYPAVRCLVVEPYADNKLLEYLFIDVEQLGLAFCHEINIKAEFQLGRVRWWMNRDVDSCLICAEVKYRHVDRKYGRIQMRYGWEDVYDSQGNFVYRVK